MQFKIILTALIFAILGTSTFADTIEAREAFKKGCKFLEEEKYYQAINNFKATLADNSYPLLDYSYYFIAQAYQKDYHFKESIQVYETVVDYFKNSILVPKALFGIAQNQIELKKHSDANSSLRKLIVQFPKNRLIPEARYLLGINLEKTDKFVDAARVYRNLDLMHPDSDFAEKALERLDRLARKKHLAGYEAPAATIYNLGIKYFKKRNYVKSKGYFTRLAKFYKKIGFSIKKGLRKRLFSGYGKNKGEVADWGFYLEGKDKFITKLIKTKSAVEMPSDEW